MRIVLTISLALLAMSTSDTQVAVLPEKEAARLADQCSRAAPPSFKGTWSPSGRGRCVSQTAPTGARRRFINPMLQQGRTSPELGWLETATRRHRRAGGEETDLRQRVAVPIVGSLAGRR